MEILAAVLIVGQLVLLAVVLIGLVAFFGLLAYDAVVNRGKQAAIAELPVRESGARVTRLSA